MISPQPDPHMILRRTARDTGAAAGRSASGPREQMALARTRLALRSFRGGWAIFVESRIGVLSLATIVLFALMAISHPILMATVWDAEVYDPVTGYAFDRLEHPSPPELEASPGHRPAGAGRAQPVVVQHPVGVRAGDHRGAGHGGHRHHGGRGRGLLRRVGGRAASCGWRT